LLVVDVVTRFGVGILYVVDEMWNLRVAALSPAIGFLIGLSDLMRWTATSGSRHDGTVRLPDEEAR
jgi:hypothetical protein